MFANYFLNPSQFSSTTRKTYRIQPELGRLVITIHVNMRRLVRLVTVKVDAVRACVQNSGHNNVQHLKNCNQERALNACAALMAAPTMAISSLVGITSMALPCSGLILTISRR